MFLFLIEKIMINSTSIELFIRLFFSFIAGFIIGLERERNGNPAGLKTHILVCLGACLIMIISMHAFDGGDPARLAAQVVSGIGFIGAGAIMRDNAGGVRGITTAATLWIAACIGLGFGSGMFTYSLIALLLVSTTLIFIKKIENKIARKNCIITLTCNSNQMIADIIITTLNEYEIKIKDLSINPIINDNLSNVIITLFSQSISEEKIRNSISVISSKLNTQSLHVKNLIQ